jgi:hypothetical protein
MNYELVTCTLNCTQLDCSRWIAPSTDGGTWSINLALATRVLCNNIPPAEAGGNSWVPF